MLYLFLSLTYAQVSYYSESDVDRVLRCISTVKNHTNQQETYTLLNKVNSNLKISEIESIRTKLKDRFESSNLNDSQKINLINNTSNEALYFYYQSLTSIDGVRFFHEPETRPTAVRPRPQNDREALLSLFRSRPTREHISNNLDARNFYFPREHITFEYNNKVYSLNANALGVSIRLVTDNAARYTELYNGCFPGPENPAERESLCSDYGKIHRTTYKHIDRGRNREFESDFSAFYMSQRSNYDYVYNKDGSVEYSNDKISMGSPIFYCMNSMNLRSREFRHEDRERIRQAHILQNSSTPSSGTSINTGARGSK